MRTVEDIALLDEKTVQEDTKVSKFGESPLRRKEQTLMNTTNF